MDLTYLDAYQRFDRLVEIVSAMDWYFQDHTIRKRGFQSCEAVRYRDWEVLRSERRPSKYILFGRAAIVATRQRVSRVESYAYISDERTFPPSAARQVRDD